MKILEVDLNPTLTNKISTVMNNAGIDYTIEDKEAMSENSLREVIKEIIRKNIKK
jgi:hypothetical protein